MPWAANIEFSDMRTDQTPLTGFQKDCTQQFKTTSVYAYHGNIIPSTPGVLWAPIHYSNSARSEVVQWDGFNESLHMRKLDKMPLVLSQILEFQSLQQYSVTTHHYTGISVVGTITSLRRPTT